MRELRVDPGEDPILARALAGTLRGDWLENWHKARPGDQDAAAVHAAMLARQSAG